MHVADITPSKRLRLRSTVFLLKPNSLNVLM